MADTQTYHTIYQPTDMSPSPDGANAIDMGLNQDFTATIHGSVVDSYRVQIKKIDNTVLYDTATSQIISNTNSGITYSGTWQGNSTQNVDDTDSNVQYYGSGWGTLNNQYYYNNTIHQSSTENDYIQYSFLGTGVNLYFTFGKDKGVCDIYIDNVLKQELDTYVVGTDYNGYNFQVLGYSINNLEEGNHTVKILVKGTKNTSSTSNQIEFDYLQVLNSGSAKNSSATGSYFQYTFNSTGINLYFDNTPQAGIAEVYIDGKDMGSVNCYSATWNLNVLGYSNTNLSAGSHTIKVVVTGNKDDISQNCIIYFEQLELLTKTILSTYLYDNDIFKLTIPANTITYKGALKWQLTVWNSSNNGESVSSSEMIFQNMSTPIITENIPTQITSRNETFIATYSQSENIPTKEWDMSLYSINYLVDCGKFGQAINGTTLDCGVFGQTPNRYFIDCGNW